MLATTTELPGCLAWAGGSPWLALVVGLVFGSMTLKLFGQCLPLGTIAWGISLYFLFGTMETLGGHTDLTGIPPIELFGWVLDRGEEIYYVIWFFLMLPVFTTQNLLDLREGRAIRALKGGMVMAEAMGVNTSRSRMILFVIAALHACALGWLYAHMQRFVNSTPFGLHIGIEYLFMAVVGGADHIWGALIGAGVITIAKQWLHDILPRIFVQSGNFEVIYFGLMMVVILQRASDGLWSMIERLGPVRTVRRRLDAATEALPRKALPGRGEAIRCPGQVTAVQYIRDLSVSYGEVTALSNTNIGVGGGQIVTVIMGLLESTGKVDFDRAIEGVPVAERMVARGMNLVSERRELFGEMTVEDNLVLGAVQRYRMGNCDHAQTTEEVDHLFPRLKGAPRPARRRSARHRGLSRAGGDTKRCGRHDAPRTPDP